MRRLDHMLSRTRLSVLMNRLNSSIQMDLRKSHGRKRKKEEKKKKFIKDFDVTIKVHCDKMDFFLMVTC